MLLQEFNSVWLLIHGRVQCRVNLCRKTIVDSSICEVCSLEDETGEHIVFDCPFAQQFWQRLGFQTNQPSLAERMINVQCPQMLKKKTFNVLKAFQNSISVPLWPYATGTSGSDEMGLYSERRQPQFSSPTDNSGCQTVGCQKRTVQ